jgi:hypothetical protein
VHFAIVWSRAEDLGRTIVDGRDFVATDLLRSFLQGRPGIGCGVADALGHLFRGCLGQEKRLKQLAVSGDFQEFGSDLASRSVNPLWTGQQRSQELGLRVPATARIPGR